METLQKKQKIMIAEDDADIIELLRLYLENAGYEVISAPDGFSAWELIQESKPDLAILDVMMPYMNGYELTKKIRESMRIPIIILSAKNQDNDKILGLNLGADDYVAKPFNPLELVARVQSNLRRAYQFQAPENPSQLRIGDLILDTERVSLTKAGEEIPLTKAEYKILALLMSNPGRVFTKIQIYEYVNGDYYVGDDNTMAVHISNLRDKIEENSRQPVYLKTIRGLGYKFEKL